MITFGSLFTGIGGFDRGLGLAGMQCLWQVEIDTKCNNVLNNHWPNVKRYTDVKEVGKHNLKPVDLICGGFPCQDVSVAGRRAGLAGERSGLWWEFHRVIEELRPRWCIIENVPGLLSSNEGRDMGAILWALGELRYGWAYRVLDAQYFGVAQRRRRVFIIGCLGDAGRAAQVLFEPESCERDSPPSRETGARVAATLAKRFAGGSNQWALYNEADNLIAPTLTERMGRYSSPDPATGRDTPIVVAMDVRNLREQPGEVSGTLSSKKSGGYSLNYQNPVVLGFSQESDGSTARNAKDLARPITGRHGDPGCVAYNIQQNDGGSHKRKDRPNGGMYVSETEHSLTLGSSDKTVVAFQSNRDGCDAINELAPTLRVGTGLDIPSPPAVAFTEHTHEQGRTLEAQEELSLTNPGAGGRSYCRQIVGGFGVRRLTPIECERLQGFPDNWTEQQSDSARYKQLGNAVAVPVVEWIGQRIVSADDTVPD